MKTKLIIPILILSLSITVSSFSQPSGTGYSTSAYEFEPYFGVDDCGVAGIDLLLYNGMDVSQPVRKYNFTFCPDGSLEVFDMHTYRRLLGRWEFYEVGAPITIHLDCPENGDPMYADLFWLDGTWETVEHSENVLDLQRSEGKDFWQVRFQRLLR